MVTTNHAELIGAVCKVQCTEPMFETVARRDTSLR
jgi:hypothetical protein